MTFLLQSDKFIRTKVVIGQKNFKWSDDIKPKDDITPFDGSCLKYLKQGQNSDALIRIPGSILNVA